MGQSRAVTIREAAERLDRPVSSIMAAARNGRLPIVGEYDGMDTIVEVEAVERWDRSAVRRNRRPKAEIEQARALDTVLTELVEVMREQGIQRLTIDDDGHVEGERVEVTGFASQVG